jgi:HAD superfamily hydrolase (TIGR01509 family)
VTFDAVIFDCDGVLVDSEVLALEVELSLLGELGLEYDPVAFAHRYMGMPDAAFFAALGADYRDRTGRSLPDTFPGLHRQRLTQALAMRLRAVPDVELAGAACSSRKAVASSSTPAALRGKLEQVGLWASFAPHIYGGTLVKRGKPAPNLFLHAADALGVSPSRCLVLEDSVNGVLAGCAAGMTVWGFVGGRHCSAASGPALVSAGASRSVGDWREFVRLLERR